MNGGAEAPPDEMEMRRADSLVLVVVLVRVTGNGVIEDEVVSVPVGPG